MIKTKKELSPDLVAKKTSNLVPLRNRFPKARIKELPGWRHFGSQSPSLIKITSTKPFKVKSKREFNSPPLYATDEHKNFIFESKSSKILPRLVNHNSQKYLINKDQKTNTIYEKRSKNKEKVSISLMIHQEPDSDNDSTHLNPLFSHRSIKPPESAGPMQGSSPSKITASLDPAFQVKENFEVFPSISRKSHLKPPNQSLLESQEDSECFEQTKPGKGEEKASNSNQLLAKGLKARLSTSRNSRTRGENLFNRQKSSDKSWIHQEKLLIQVDSQEENPKSVNFEENDQNLNKDKVLSQTKDPSSNSHEFSTKQFLNLQSFERNDSRPAHLRESRKKHSQKSQLNNASNSRISDEYLENPDNELYEQLNIGSRVKRKEVKFNENENSDEDLSVSSSISDDEEDSATNLNSATGKKVNSVNQGSKKELIRADSNREHSVAENDYKDDQSDFEGSGVFSPKLTKRKNYESTITPVTNPSTTTNHSPVIKTPDIRSPTRLVKQDLQGPPGKSLSKIQNKSRQKTFKKQKTSEKSLKKSKSRPEPQTKRKNEVSHTEYLKKSSEVSQENLESQFQPDENSKLHHSSTPDNSKQFKSKPRSTLNAASKKSRTKKSLKSPALKPESSSDESFKLSIKVTEVPDQVKDSVYSQNTDLMKSLVLPDELSELNKSSLSSRSFLKVRKTGKDESRLSSREGSKREGLFAEVQKSQKRKSKRQDLVKNEDSSKSKRPEIVKNEDSSKVSSKYLKKSRIEGESSGDESSASLTSSFSNYSVIKKIELEQRFLKKSETLSRKNPLKTSTGMRYMKNYVSGEVKKYIRKLDPVNNFIYNFSFSILKSIKNLLKVQNLIGIRRTSNNAAAKRLRLEHEQAEKDLLTKNKLKTNKNPQELKKTLTKHFSPPAKPTRTQNHLQTYYPREIALKVMHSGKNTPKSSSRKKPSTSITTENNEKSSDALSSESSLDLPILEDPSKKVLLYELSHQELALQIAKQILHNKNSSDEVDADLDLDPDETSKNLESLDLDDEIRELASKLKTVPKTFAFGPGVNLSLIKQNQMFFDFRELEKGKFEIDFENLNRFSRKQEFLGMKPLETSAQHFEQFTLQVLPQDILTDEQQYRQRLKKATILGKKLRRRREKLTFSPQFSSNQLINNQGLQKSLKSKEFKYDTNDFDERVYLRLKGSPSFRVQSL